MRYTANDDLKTILENDTKGFRWPISITAPGGATESFFGFTNDISQVIDPETGQAISGRQASVAIRIGAFDEKRFEIPKNIADETSKPWVVKFDDIAGKAYSFKVIKSNPDRSLGVISLILEFYECL